MEIARAAMRFLMAAVYLLAGCLHVVAPESFLPIMPPWVPFPTEVVIFTGVCEIAGAQGLLLPKTRRLAGIMLAIYAVCVFPANLHHAFSGIAIKGLPDSWWYHGPRLAAQPVVVWWSLFCAGVISWPFRRPASASRAPTTHPGGPDSPA